MTSNIASMVTRRRARQAGEGALVLLLHPQAPHLRARRVGYLNRATARIRAAHLDRQLAAGACPDGTPALAWRARVLVRPAARAQLARSLERVVARAAGEVPAPRLGVPLDRRAVAEAAGEVHALVDRLCSPGPVPAGGVARVRVLLSDGGGPLYHRHVDTGLVDALRAALDRLCPLDAPS